MKKTCSKNIYSIDGLTLDQKYILSLCLDLIRDHTHFDEESGEYEVVAEDIVHYFKRNEYQVLNSIKVF